MHKIKRVIARNAPVFCPSSLSLISAVTVYPITLLLFVKSLLRLLKTVPLRTLFHHDSYTTDLLLGVVPICIPKLHAPATRIFKARAYMLTREIERHFTEANVLGYI